MDLSDIVCRDNLLRLVSVNEIWGISCLSIDDISVDKQQIVCSRSFKRRLTSVQELAEALASFCSRAAEKLRNQNSVTGSITVFIKTNSYNLDEPQYQRSIHVLLNQATSDTRQIIATAKRLLKAIFKEGYRYQKCGVQLGNIQAALLPSQIDLFDFVDQNNSAQLMSSIDQINNRFPKAITFSATGINTGWQVSVEHLSQHYTTNWNELAIVKCN